MGVRGIVRDILTLYLTYEIIRGAIYKSFTINLPMILVSIILLILAVWFLLERIGILPKLT